jgi:hypothetical protein
MKRTVSVFMAVALLCITVITPPTPEVGAATTSVSAYSKAEKFIRSGEGDFYLYNVSESQAGGYWRTSWRVEVLDCYGGSCISCPNQQRIYAGGMFVMAGEGSWQSNWYRDNVPNEPEDYKIRSSGESLFLINPTLYDEDYNSSCWING